MGLFRKNDPPRIPYDPEKQTPAVRSSICTGEMTVGFLDRETGRFREYELAHDRKELALFCKRVGIQPEELQHIY